ncbi:MAG TPA: 2'-5' RNA ligase family protein [Gemmatimonadaceae bacterium]|nr:2'-5' RNA ligase family protein [Gemmatimonadaceae bacterium]
MKTGIYIVAEMPEPVRTQVLEVQRWADPRLARGTPPHVTLVGSSGAGPIPVSTTLIDVELALAPIVADTAPIVVKLGAPVRFMQTHIIVLPLDPHGPLRTLHERIRSSGLRYEAPRFPFSPHVTLSFYRELVPERAKKLLSTRIDDPVTIDRLQVYVTDQSGMAKRAMELRLGDQQSVRG